MLVVTKFHDMAKYFKVLESVETEPLEPVDVYSNEVTFSRKHLSWKKLLCAATFIVLITLTIVFIALYAHEISKKKSTGITKTSKDKMSTTERTKVTTTTTTTATTTAAATAAACLSHTCVKTAAGQSIKY